MRQGIKFLFCMLICMILSGCESLYETHYSYQPPVSESGKTCIKQCLETKNTCQTQCQIRDQNCRRDARQKAYHHYTRYQSYQKAHGLPVQKHLSDFDDSYAKCFHTCHCTNEFNMCYERCGGIVSAKKECVD